MNGTSSRRKLARISCAGSANSATNAHEAMQNRDATTRAKIKNHPVKYHADISCEDDAIWATSASSATRENQTQQVDAAKTISRTPCEDATPTSTTKNASSDYGLKCWHAYRSSVNQRKDADKNLDEKIAKAKEVCRCCGRKGHTAKECNKLKAHLNA